MRLNVPRAVRVGHSVTLECDYDLETAPLYSVKWYRGPDEFYRYVPKEEPPTRVFPLPGLHVDVSPYLPISNVILSCMKRKRLYNHVWDGFWLSIDVVI